VTTKVATPPGRHHSLVEEVLVKGVDVSDEPEPPLGREVSASTHPVLPA
jgi:hypothetical protein